MGTINLLIFRHPSKTPCHLTHTNQPNSPAFQVSQFTTKLFAINFKSGFKSGIREVIDAQFYGSSTCENSKHTVWKTFLSSVRRGIIVDKRKPACWIFFVFISCSKITHTASFLFSDSYFSAAQMAKSSLLALTVASLDHHLVFHAWCIARQADRNVETLQHFSIIALKCFRSFVHHSVQICDSIVRGQSEAVRLIMHRYHTYNFRC